MLLTGQHLLNYQRCDRQAFLDVHGDDHHKAPPSDFLQKLRDDRQHFQQEVLGPSPLGSASISRPRLGDRRPGHLRPHAPRG